MEKSFAHFISSAMVQSLLPLVEKSFAQNHFSMIGGHLTYLLWKKALQKGEGCLCKVFFTMAILLSTIRECLLFNA